MKFRDWFSNCQNLRPRRRRSPQVPQLESLEARALLAGNVQATFANNTLTLTGDAADNTVDVSIEDGNIVVRGFDSTTINGAASFQVAAGTTRITGDVLLRMGAGNDTAFLSNGLQVGGDVDLIDLVGNNRLALDSATVDGFTRFETGAGNDSVTVGNSSTVKKTLWALTRTGDDLVTVKDSRIERDLSLHMGRGDDDVVLDNVVILDDAKIFTYYGQDDVSIKGSRITDQLTIKVGRDADVIRIEGTTVGGRVFAMLGRGDDDFETVGTNDFGGNFTVIPTAGDDAIEISSGTTQDGTRSIAGAESSDSDTTRLDTAVTGAIAKANAALNLVTETTLPFSVVTSGNTDAQQGNGTLITRNDQFVITGTTRPGATVTVDISRPGAAVGDFSDGTVTAGADGAFSITVTLLRDDVNNGANVITVKASESSRSRTETINVHLAVGTVARLATSLGDIEVELLDEDAPETVDNFLAYFSRYAGTVFHRSAHTGADPFIIQGGGFKVADGVATQIDLFDEIDNEHSDENPNVRGTLSMATIGGDPDSGTSQWFINTANNTALDADTALHTVFGRVLGDGMEVADAIHALREVNIADELTGAGAGAFSEAPLRDTYVLGGTLTGTVTVAANSTSVTGTGTAFTTQLQARVGNTTGSTIQIGNQTFEVVAINSNTSLTIDRPHVAGASAATARFVNSAPANADFVLLNTATVLIPRP